MHRTTHPLTEEQQTDHALAEAEAALRPLERGQPTCADQIIYALQQVRQARAMRSRPPASLRARSTITSTLLGWARRW